eukprot:m.251314 g.251314  ORF g.251314 m.251314 type:complete len:612 (+) comp16148_c0_seq6:222-2057(+)
MANSSAFQVEDLFVDCVGSRHGHMGVDELVEALHRLNTDVDEGQAEILLQKLDKNQDGIVTLDDFAEAISDFTNLSGLANKPAEDGLRGARRRSRFSSPKHSETDDDNDRIAKFSRYLERVAGRTNLSDDDLKLLMSCFEEGLGSLTTVHEEEVQILEAASEQAIQSHRELQKRFAMLSDEMQRQESELASSLGYKRMAEERLQQIEVLKKEVKTLQSDTLALNDLEAKVRAKDGEIRRLNSKVETQNAQMLEQLEKVHSLETQLGQSSAKVEDLQEERDNLLQEFSGLVDQLKRKGVSVQFKAGQLAQENQELRASLKEMEETLAMKNSSITRLRSQLEDQTLIVNGLQAERMSQEAAPFKASLMDEIEHLMMNQGRDNTDNESVTSEATHSVSDMDSKAQQEIEESPPKSTNTESNGKKMVLQPAAELTAIMATPIVDRGSTPKLADTPTPNKIARPTSKGPSRPHGTRNKSHALHDRLKVYAAASASHLTGRQIVTRQTAMEMSTQALRRTAAALQDLVDAKSTQLIQALDEREWLETDIQLKNKVVRFYVNATSLDLKAASSPAKPGSKYSSSASNSATKKQQTPLPAASRGSPLGFLSPKRSNRLF